MGNVDLRCILPGKLYEEKNTVFACFKTYANYLYQSVLSSNCIISYHIFLRFSISVNLKFQKIKTEALVVINLFFRKYIYLSISPSYFHQSDQFHYNICSTYLCCHISWAFFEMFVFVCFCLWFCCCFCSFLFRFHLWPKF